ncbi:MAG: WD40 repeat domain-containing protein [Gemmataceae bacterium]
MRQLEKATKAANGQLRNGRIEQEEGFWQRLVAGAARQREGVHTFLGAAMGSADLPLVRVAWWTDHVGRRHWRVIGGRQPQADRSDHALAQEPLVHLYPERLLLRQIGDWREVLAVCRCGAAGPPAALGWDGERCGLCHDRQEEGLPPTGEACAIRTGHTATINAVAFSHDGRLVSGGNDGRVIACQLDTGEGTELCRSIGAVQQLSVSTTGLVAARTGSVWVEFGDLDGAAGWTCCRLPCSFPITFAFTPDGNWLGVTDQSSCWLLGGTASANLVVKRHVRLQAWSQVAFVPDGETIVTGVGNDDQPPQRISLRTGATRPLGDAHEWMNPTPRYGTHQGNTAVACSSDGRWAAVVGDRDGAFGIHVCELPGGRWQTLTHPSFLTGLRALQFVHDGLVFAAADNLIGWWDCTTGTKPHTLAFPGLPPLRVVFSPDGEQVTRLSLVRSGMEDGPVIRVWPWRRLLEGDRS